MNREEVKEYFKTKKTAREIDGVHFFESGCEIEFDGYLFDGDTLGEVINDVISYIMNGGEE